jgi:hypothetical protein
LNLENSALLDYITSASIFTWARTIASHQQATSGRNWADLFAYEHSGTYNNQWMIMDHSKFYPGMAPLDNFLTILEEIPGFNHIEDATAHLKVSVSITL